MRLISERKAKSAVSQLVSITLSIVNFTTSCVCRCLLSLPHLSTWRFVIRKMRFALDVVSSAFRSGIEHQEQVFGSTWLSTSA